MSRLAYNTRKSEYLRVAYDPVMDCPDLMENISRIKIRHCVGRLGAVSRASKILTQTASSHPDLFSGFSVDMERSGVAIERPQPYPGLTLLGISGRMFPSDSTAMREFREALKRLDNHGSIMTRVIDHYQDDNWQPRAHAELQLMEMLYETQCTFYDDDKYIACSKPACFCCYHYICEHPGSFARPPCHNKVYLNWQPPGLTGKSEAQCNRQQAIMNGVTKHVRQAVIQRVLNADRGRKWHPDSSTGITPSIAVVNQLQAQAEPLMKISESTVSPCRSPHSSDEDFEDGGVALLTLDREELP